MGHEAGSGGGVVRRRAALRWALYCLLPALAAAASAAPASFTYQGNLWEGGIPVNAAKSMMFRITDAGGGTVYWSTGPFSVDVLRGHFAVNLSPSGVAWESLSPYIEVTVEGNTLLPREPLSAVPYTFHADVMNRAAAGTSDPPGTPVPGQLYYRSDLGRLRLYNGAWVDVTVGNDNPWQLAGSDIYYSGGRVGIGTTAPVSALHVVDGDLRISSTTSPRGIYFPDGSFMDSAGAGSASSLASNVDVLITGDADANGSGGVILRTGSADRFVLTNAGSIGIGTLTPAALLDVAGTLNATSLQGGGAGLTGLTAANVSPGSFASGNYSFPGNLSVGGSLGGDLNAGGFRVTNLAAPSAAGDAATKAYVDSAAAGLGAALLSATQTFTGLNTFTNQVSVSSHLVLTGQVIAGSGAVAITTPAGLLDATQLAGTVPNAAHDPSSVTLQGNTFNGANQLVRLDLAGALPALDGSALVNVTASDPSKVLKAGDTMSGQLTILGSSLTIRGAGSSSATAALQVANAAGQTGLLVRDDGNVGIGTLSPAYRMEIVSPGGVAAQMDTSDPGYLSLRVNGVEVARVKP